MSIRRVINESFLGMKHGLSIHEDPERLVMNINYHTDLIDKDLLSDLIDANNKEMEARGRRVKKEIIDHQEVINGSFNLKNYYIVPIDYFWKTIFQSPLKNKIKEELNLEENDVKYYLPKPYNQEYMEQAKKIVGRFLEEICDLFKEEAICSNTIQLFRELIPKDLQLLHTVFTGSYLSKEEQDIAMKKYFKIPITIHNKYVQE